MEMKSFSSTPYSTRKDSPGCRVIGPKVSESVQPLDSFRPMSDFAVVFHPLGSSALEFAEILWLVPVSTVAVYGTGWSVRLVNCAVPSFKYRRAVSTKRHSGRPSCVAWDSSHGLCRP